MILTAIKPKVNVGGSNVLVLLVQVVPICKYALFNNTAQFYNLPQNKLHQVKLELLREKECR